MTTENLLVLGILAVLIMLAAGVISAFMNNSGDAAWQEVQVHLNVIPRYDDEPLGQRDTLLAQATSEQAGK